VQELYVFGPISRANLARRRAAWQACRPGAKRDRLIEPSLAKTSPIIADADIAACLMGHAFRRLVATSGGRKEGRGLALGLLRTLARPRARVEPRPPSEPGTPTCGPLRGSVGGECRRTGRYEGHGRQSEEKTTFR